MFEPVPPDVRDAIAAAQPELGAFAHVRFAAEVDSTNDLALDLATRGAPEGTAVLADQQHRGRGRRGHSWFSPAGAGLYVSIVVRPPHDPQLVALVTLAAGVAVAQALGDVSHLPIELKWPNDIGVGRRWRKLGGILTEAATTGGRLDAVVVGIGLNLTKANYPLELEAIATSIESELARPVSRADVLVAVLRRLRGVMEHLHARRHVDVLDEWRRLGRRALDRSVVRWTDHRGEQRGETCAVGDDGALLVVGSHGIERIVAGALTWETFGRG